MHGVLMLDKPAGFSSNQALNQAKRLLRAQKAGHTGTLDPFATGLLPLCFGEATKFSQDLLEADKTYETVIKLGETTDTGDIEGKVLQQREVAVNHTQLETVLQQFRGDIAQIPPMYSALKRDGKPLYEYARAGITLERAPRNVTIHRLELIDFAAPYLKLRVTCSKGTYIRVLGSDIGEALGCGAHLQALRRTGVGYLTLEHSVTLDSFADLTSDERTKLLAPVDALLSLFPSVNLSSDLAQRFKQGQRLSCEKEEIKTPQQNGRVRIYEMPQQQLLGTAQLRDGVLAPERLVSAID